MNEIVPDQPIALLRKPIVINGYTNFIIINVIKYFSLAVCIVLLTTIIFSKIKHKKNNKIIIILFIISLIITFLAFFTSIYDNFMRAILPYQYGV